MPWWAGFWSIRIPFSKYGSCDSHMAIVVASVVQVTIVPRTKGVLGFAQQLPSEQRLFTRDQVSPPPFLPRSRAPCQLSCVCVCVCVYVCVYTRMHRTCIQLFDRMCVLLGGRMAEAVTFKRISTGQHYWLKPYDIMQPISPLSSPPPPFSLSPSLSLCRGSR